MSGFLRLLTFALLLLAGITGNLLAEEGQTDEADKWVPFSDEGSIQAPLIIEQAPTPTSHPDDNSSTNSVHDLTSHERIIEPAETDALPLPEVVDGIEGRPYNAPGWYSHPDWSSMGWRPGSGDRFGDFSFEGVTANPIEAWEGLSFTHGHGLHFLTGPSRTDLPPRVFDFNWGLHWFGEVTHGWWVDLSFSAGVYSDFEDSAREGWRFPSHAVVTWELSPEIHTVTGVRYFDRDNLGLLPVAGLILRPDDGIRIELVYPEPRIAWRVSADVDEERWLSVSGRIGGGEWAIERSNTGLADIATYNEYQLVLALSTVDQTASASSLEIGYVFERDLQYRSGLGNFEPSETLFIRLVTRK